MGAQRSSSRGRSGRSTSLGGGKVHSSHKLHGSREKENRARSKSRDPNKKAPRRQYIGPFDEKGRCHYHKNMQLAGKKFGGGWKILHELCPRCMEESDDDDDKSVRSMRSTKSVSKQLEELQPAQQSSNSKKKKWNFFQNKQQSGRSHPQDDDDDRSIKSSRSTRSTKSTRSGKAANSSRYGNMPFDGDGFCVHHPAVQLAKKKKLGGFKIVHDNCPSCAKENGQSSSRGSRRQRSRSCSRRKVSNDDDKSVTSSRSRKSKPTKKKRIRVKNLKYEAAETGRLGRYSGYVDDDHRPNGQGVVKYEDGTEWEGVWEQGSQVHGKSKSKSCRA